MEATTEKIAYLENGEEVVIQQELDGGYLVCRKIYAYYLDEEERDPEDYKLGQPEFINKGSVYSKAPTDKIEAKFAELNERLQKQIENQREQLAKVKKEVEDITAAKNQEAKTLLTISKIKGFHKAVEYFDKDFEFVVEVRQLTIKHKSHFFPENDLSFTLTKDGVRFFHFKNDNYHSSEHRELYIFKTQEEAISKRNELFVECVSKLRTDSYLDDFRNRYSEILKAPEIKAVFDAKVKELNEIRKETRISQLKKMINDYQVELDERLKDKISE